jgi:PDGLE domain-containing protein
MIVALALAVGLGTAVAPYASSSPDGLEKVAAKQSFLDAGTRRSIQEDAPIAGYAFPGIDSPRLATAVAGFVGVLFVFGFGYGLAYVLRRRGPRMHRSPERGPA